MTNPKYKFLKKTFKLRNLFLKKVRRGPRESLL